MATTFIFILLILSALNAAAVSTQPGQQRSHIAPGSSLAPSANSTWLSPSSLYAFGFFPQNNAYAIGIFLAGIPGKLVVVWTANVDNPTVSNDSVLQFTVQGRLVVQQSGRQDVQFVDPTLIATSASMHNNGNFVLYSNNSVIWQSFDNPTNTLLPGQRLQPGTQLVSSASDNDYTRGFFRIKMQEDGNLVQYPMNTEESSTHAYYSSGTDRTGNNVSLNLDTNGHLYLLNGTSCLMNITRAVLLDGMLYLLRIDVDGISRLYFHPLNQDGSWNFAWESVTHKCSVKGLCGYNSFCYLSNGGTTDCQCLPGFAFIKPGNRTAGCLRNFSLESCGENKDSKAGGVYEMRVIEGIDWGVYRYEVGSNMTEERCKVDCLDDCNCAATYYKDGFCSKHWLPLIHGRKFTSVSGSYHIKVMVQTTLVPEAYGIVVGEDKEVVPLDIIVMQVSLIVISILILIIHTIYFQGNHEDNNN